MTDDGEVVEHSAPYGLLARLVGFAFGIFLAVAGMPEALVLPASPSRSERIAFALAVARVLIGVFCVGWAAAAPEWRWTVRRGLVRIEYHNLFRRWRQEFGPDDVREFDLHKHSSGEGDSTWVVVLRTNAGKSIKGRHLNREQDAINLFLDMRQAFYGETLPEFYGPPA